MSCGFTARTTTSAPLIASGFEVVASTPWRSRSSIARSSRREVATMSAQSELRSPARSDSPILPVPRIAIRILQAYESGVVSRQQVHAREPGPLPVGLEQGVGLLGLDPPSPERGGELDEPEIAREASLVAAEPLEADDAGRPGAEAALALEPSRATTSVGSVFSASRSSRAAEADERRAAPGAEPEPAQLGGREPREVGARSAPRGGRRARASPRGSRCARSARARLAVISWPATARSSACATVAVRSGRSPRRCADRPARAAGRAANRRRNSEWSSSTPSTKRMPLEPRLAGGLDADGAVGALPRRDRARARCPVATVCVNTPSRTVRVASLPWRAESRSE